MYRLVLILFSLLAAGAALLTPALAQTGSTRAQDRLLEYKRRQLPQVLHLDQGQVDRLLEVERRHQPGLNRLRQDIRRDLQRLSRLLDRPQPSDAEVKAVLESLQGKRDQLQSLRQRQMDEAAALLSPQQQARYLIFQQQMRRDLLQQVRGLPGAGWGRPPGGGLQTSPPAPADTQLPDLPRD